VIEVEHEETIIVRLPVRVNISYEFWNPYKSEKETPSKLTINVEIFLTKDEAKILEESITDKMIEILNMIFEARKLEQDINTLTEVFDADPA
jgi:hypothetical protein